METSAFSRASISHASHPYGRMVTPRSSAAPACSNINPSSPILPTLELSQTARPACAWATSTRSAMERIFCTSPCSAFFSFREMTVGNAIDFWLEFLGTLGLVPDHVTIHPDRLMEWTPLYRGGVAIVAD